LDLIRLICSFFLPPLGVFLQVGFRLHFWINIILTLLGFFPGVIHAFYVIFAYDTNPFKIENGDLIRRKDDEL